MARHEGQFRAEAELEVGIADLLCESATELSDRQRQEAIVCYLTRSEGWQDAFKLLGGAFAPDGTSGGVNGRNHSLRGR